MQIGGSAVMPGCDTRSRFGQLLPLVLLLAPVGVARAQRLPNDAAVPRRENSYGHTIAVPSAVAVPLRGHVVLDGRLDEPAWAAARPITDFTQNDPDEGKPATERTEVRFLFDDDALYVGAKFYDSHGASGVTTRVGRRDGNFDSDLFEIVIDGYHDHLSRAFFDLNPAGSKGDYIGIGTSCCE